MVQEQTHLGTTGHKTFSAKPVLNKFNF